MMVKYIPHAPHGEVAPPHTEMCIVPNAGSLVLVPRHVYGS